ncbi:hypothetical protein EJD97_002825 [Solanum chilense]|uniref:Legumain prodomain domain-containing protein n=1 Tax=Solanum chilense TaxID=4083 RepID=A0A6N2C0K0_SOLCI|nr:hypothetical protein EJD97_002825 [Solanum chilense]
MISRYNIVGVFFLVLVSIFVNIEGRSISQFLAQKTKGTKWAVLIAGSSGWTNYRHQADVCHAYQILKTDGLKDENIIVFMYDDIANNTENPRPGVIINNPHGHDVYKGVPKVLKSGPNDHIFIYYADHGAPGFISCESGSMFDGILPKGLNIYVMTASKPDEASFGTYCGNGTSHTPCFGQCSPPEFKGICLGDLYSVAWMEDSDVQDRKTNTLHEQYSRVAKRTAANLTYRNYGSHVQEYGDLVVSFDPLAAYMGETSKNHSHDSVDAKSFSTSSSRNVDQRSTELFYLFTKENAPEGSDEKYDALVKLNEVMSHRSQVDSNVKHLGELLFGVEKGNEILHTVRPAGQPLVDNWDCLKSYVKIFEAHCGRLTAYGKKHVRGIANICNAGITSKKMAAMSARACFKLVENTLGSWQILCFASLCYGCKIFSFS